MLGQPILMNLPDRQPFSSVPAPADRRRHSRYAVQIPIDLHQENPAVSLRLETTDLSRGGCYVHLIKALPLASYVEATLWLDNCPVRIRARVVTRHPEFGNGIMFLEFRDHGGEQLLIRYLDANTG